MKRSDAFPSKFLGKDDIVPGRILTIGQVVPEGVESDGEMRQKAVMYFQEHDVKPWIINAGNWMTIEDAYGDESDDWSGKPIDLYVDQTVMFGGKRVGGIRVRIPNGHVSLTPSSGGKPQTQLATETIQKVDVKGDWYGITTSAGVFVTNDRDLGQTIQSFGQTDVTFTYELNGNGKRIVTAAAPATAPVHSAVDDEDIPF